MKKTSLIVAVLSVFLLPLPALAAVDMTIEDISYDDSSSLSVAVHTNGDTVEEITIPISIDGDFTLSTAAVGDVGCDAFNYELTTAEQLTMTCTFDEATELAGIVGTINFTSETNVYSLSIMEEELDLGELEVGLITNLDADGTQAADTTTEVTDTTVADTTATTTTTSDSPFSIEKITEYLPYILIGGAVILLISIIGIILSKKKDSSEGTTESVGQGNPLDNQAVDIDNVAPVTPETSATTPTLQDMVNEEQQQATTPMEQKLNTPLESAPQIETTPAITPVQEQPAVTPVQEQPAVTPVQEQPAITPVQEQPAVTPVQEQPPVQPIADADPNADLAAIMQAEQSAGSIPAAPETPTTPPVAPEVQQPPMQTEDTNAGDLPPVPPTM